MRSKWAAGPAAAGRTHVSYGTGHLNQSRRDRAAKDTIGVQAVPLTPRSTGVGPIHGHGMGARTIKLVFVGRLRSSCILVMPVVKKTDGIATSKFPLIAAA